MESLKLVQVMTLLLIPYTVESTVGRNWHRSGWNRTSRYIKYRPTHSYTRSHSGYYYNLYFYHSGTYRYINRDRPGVDILVCANYQANENGTVMGVFTCPNYWEPRQYTDCCGQNYSEYCCEPDKANDPLTIGLIIGVLAACAMITLTVYLVKKRHVKRLNKDSQIQRMPIQTGASSINPQTGSGHQLRPISSNMEPVPDYDNTAALPTATSYPAVASYTNTIPYPDYPKGDFNNPAFEVGSEMSSPPSYKASSDFLNAKGNPKYA